MPLLGGSFPFGLGRPRDPYPSVADLTIVPREKAMPAPIFSRTPRRPVLPSDEHAVCGNPDCTHRGRPLWRSRRRPVFEGRWGCTARCLEGILQQALRREQGGAQHAAEREHPHQHRIPLGLVMLSQGWITQAQLRRALQAQRSAGQGLIGDWLMRECGLSQAIITRALALQWGCPVLSVDGFKPEWMALAAPRLLVKECGLLPLRVAGSRILYAAFRAQIDASASFALEQMSGLPVVTGLLDDQQYAAAQQRLLAAPAVPAEVFRVTDITGLPQKIAQILDESQPVASRLVRVHQHYWLRTWLEAGAYSDVGTLPATGEDVRDTILTIHPGK